MKQSKRIVAVLMTMVMLLTASSISVYAQPAPYDVPAGYNVLDKPYFSAEQGATYLLDMLDEMLREADQIIEVDLSILGSITINATSIDNLTNSLRDLWEWNLLQTAFGMFNFGDAEDLNMSAIYRAPLRSGVGSTDLQVIYNLMNFIKDNYRILGKVIDGTLSLGMLENFFELPEMMNDIPGFLKLTLYNALIDKEAEAVPAGVTLDGMIQQLIAKYLVTGYTDDDGNFVEPFLPSMAGYTDLATTSLYDFVQQIINSVLTDVAGDFLAKTLLDLAGVEFSEEYPEGNMDNVDEMIWGLIMSIAGDENIEYTEEEMSSPLRMMKRALEYYLVEGGLDEYFYFDETGLHLTDTLIELLDGLIRMVVTMLPNMGFLSEQTEYLPAEEVEALPQQELFAYAIRLILTEFVENSDIPGDCTTIKEVITYMLAGMAAEVIPEKEYYQKIDAGTLDPASDEAVYEVGAGILTYYLNALIPIEIPEDLGFEELLGFIVDWALDTYGTMIDISDINHNDTVWQKLDKTIFELIPTDWLPQTVTGADGVDVPLTGSESLVKDWLLDSIFNLDYVKLLDIFATNPDSELNLPVSTVLIRVIGRFISNFFGGNTVIPQTITNFEQLISKANLRAIVENFCRLLADYDQNILPPILPFFVASDYVLPRPGTYPTYSPALLKDLIQELHPDNGDLLHYEQGYFFFRGEDFSMLHTYNNFNDAEEAAWAVLKIVEEDPASLVERYDPENPPSQQEINQAITKAVTDAAYRLEYYYTLMDLGRRGQGELKQLDRNIRLAQAEGYEYSYVEDGTTYYNFTAASWTEFQRALNYALETQAAVRLDVNGTISQSRITLARRALIVAEKNLKSFVPYADYSMLNAYIEQANNILNSSTVSDYTEESVQNLREALILAEAFPKDKTWEEQDDVDAMALALQAAINGLAYLKAASVEAVPNSSFNANGARITPLIIDPGVLGATGFIYGVPEYTGLELSHLKAIGGARLDITKTAVGTGVGTGTLLRVYQGATLRSRYYVIMLGDVTGDGVIDALDKNIIEAYYNGNLNWNSKQHLVLAADVNKDGVVDARDAKLVEAHYMNKGKIDQLNGGLLP